MNARSALLNLTTSLPSSLIPTLSLRSSLLTPFHSLLTPLAFTLLTATPPLFNTPTFFPIFPSSLFMLPLFPIFTHLVKIMH